MHSPTESLRIFIGIALPEPVKKQLCHVQATLQKAAEKGKWPCPDYFHVTLKFIGTTEIERLNEISQVIAHAVSESSPLQLTLGGCASFGFKASEGAVSLRILYQAIESDAFLNTLYANVEAALDTLGIAKEARPYTPHITLGKDVKMTHFAYENLGIDRLTESTPPADEGIMVDTIHVFKSENVHGSMQYIPMREIKLGGK